MSIMADTQSGGGTITTLLTRSCMGRGFDPHHVQVFIFLPCLLIHFCLFYNGSKHMDTDGHSRI
jgi:hypothetical protein